MKIIIVWFCVLLAVTVVYGQSESTTVSVAPSTSAKLVSNATNADSLGMGANASETTSSTTTSHVTTTTSGSNHETTTTPSQSLLNTTTPLTVQGINATQSLNETFQMTTISSNFTELGGNLTKSQSTSLSPFTTTERFNETTQPTTNATNFTGLGGNATNGQSTTLSPVANATNGQSTTLSPVANATNGQSTTQSPVTNATNGQSTPQSPVANATNGQSTSQSPATPAGLFNETVQPIQNATNITELGGNVTEKQQSTSQIPFAAIELFNNAFQPTNATNFTEHGGNDTTTPSSIPEMAGTTTGTNSTSAVTTTVQPGTQQVVRETTIILLTSNGTGIVENATSQQSVAPSETPHVVETSTGNISTAMVLQQQSTTMIPMDSNGTSGQPTPAPSCDGFINCIDGYTVGVILALAAGVAFVAVISYVICRKCVKPSADGKYTVMSSKEDP